LPSLSVSARQPSQSDSPSVLDADDRVLVRPSCEKFSELRGAELLPFRVENVFAVPVEFGARAIERERHVRAGVVTAALDRFERQLQPRFVARQVRCEPAFVSDRRREALALEDALQRVEDLRTAAQRFAKLAAPTGTIMNSWISRLLLA